MPARTLDIYLEDGLLQSAEQGAHNYFNHVQAAFEGCGFAVRFRPNGVLERAASLLTPGYSLFHMDHPDHPRALTTRRAYYYPFWRIEASAKRWDWAVARRVFDADSIDSIDSAAATRFFNAWRKRIFGDAPGCAERGGYIYMPLQGRLSEQRSFQSMSPLQMVEETLAADPKRPVRATLHPKEDYSPADRAALDRLVQMTPRFEVTEASMETLLTGADYVVTQNSAAAFAGLFFRKPAVLFARTDFHHIAENVAEHGVETAFRRVQDPARAYAPYVYWFLQLQSINAGRPDAEARILETVKTHGWRV